MEIFPRAVGDTRRRLISFVASFAVALTVVAVAADRRRRRHGTVVPPVSRHVEPTESTEAPESAES